MERMVGIKDVARHAGVSVGTVSNVINRPDTVSEETLHRVRAVIDRLGYVRSESARQLRAGRSRIMALLVLDMGNPFFVDVGGRARPAARRGGGRGRGGVRRRRAPPPAGGPKRGGG
ncbi:LacI family DNA-binding transcriptional regulator, partial [Streptomyces sp. NPDC047123]|uniref:LacI family DNA-binding transcriptional regulator n=1 Tax=Streptomyces sp. NPDC047123 TaxID=3155622 RepID=UPI0033DB2BA8